MTDRSYTDDPDFLAWELRHDFDPAIQREVEGISADIRELMAEPIEIRPVYMIGLEEMLRETTEREAAEMRIELERLRKREMDLLLANAEKAAKIVSLQEENAQYEWESRILVGTTLFLAGSIALYLVLHMRGCL